MKTNDIIETMHGPARVKHIRPAVVETTKGEFTLADLLSTQIADSIETLTSLIDGEDDSLAELLTPIKDLLERIPQ
jgi:hypothetical protein